MFIVQITMRTLTTTLRGSSLHDAFGVIPFPRQAAACCLSDGSDDTDHITDRIIFCTTDYTADHYSKSHLVNHIFAYDDNF